VDRPYRKEAQKEIEAVRGKPDIEVGEKEIAFTVVLVDHGNRKIRVIRKIRDLMHLSPKEARDLVESVPCELRSGVSEEEAENIKEEMEDAGATVRLKTMIKKKP
ncbi:MAG: 50S ribosomal protein L7/L12, partial [Candidatus Omnitrophota bacterium]